LQGRDQAPLLERSLSGVLFPSRRLKLLLMVP
jgi:hypothetical protein